MNFSTDKFYNYLTERCSNYTFGFWFFCSLVIFDQLTKFLFNKFAPSIIFLNSKLIFDITAPQYIVIVLYIFVITFVFYFTYFSKKINPALGVMILAGGISNFFDRVYFGQVIDFIHIGSAVFNIADFYIIFALLILIFKNNLNKL